MMDVETLQLALAAEDLLKGWGLTNDSLVITTGSIGHLEHLTHELAHAQSMDLEFNESTSAEISRLLKDDDHGIKEEARAWAIEWHVWQTLKIPLEWDDLICGAEIQGVDEEDVKVLLDKPDIRHLAERVVDDLKQISADLHNDTRDERGHSHRRWGQVTSGKGPWCIVRHDGDRDCLKTMSTPELMKLAAFHIRDVDGDTAVAQELLNRVKRS